MFLWLPYYSPKSFGFFFIRLFGMFSCHSLPIVDRIFFHCFGISCFVCIVLAFLDVSLFFLLWPVLSGLFPQVVLLFFSTLPVPSSRLLQRLSFWSLGLVFVVSFAFQVKFPIPVLTVSSCFLRGSQFSHKLILLLHILVHLTRFYYLSVCKVVCDLFYSFLS